MRLNDQTVPVVEDQGNAGLVFRVNNPVPGAVQIRGYYLGFSTGTPYLGKMSNV